MFAVFSNTFTVVIFGGDDVNVASQGENLGKDARPPMNFGVFCQQRERTPVAFGQRSTYTPMSLLKRFSF